MTESNNMKVQRETIYSVLQYYLSEDDLNTALDLWEAESTDRRLSLRIDLFVMKIAKHRKVALSILEIKDKLSKGLEAPIAASNSPTRRQYGAQEIPRAHIKNVADDDASETATVALLVFSTLLDGLINEIKVNSENSKLAIKDSINEVKLSSLEKDDLEAFVEGYSNQLHQNYSKEVMTTILNQLYVTACELLGPVKADDCLSNAVHRTEKLDAARKVPPRSLL